MLSFIYLPLVIVVFVKAKEQVTFIKGMFSYIKKYHTSFTIFAVEQDKGKTVQNELPKTDVNEKRTVEEPEKSKKVLEGAEAVKCNDNKQTTKASTKRSRRK